MISSLSHKDRFEDAMAVFRVMVLEGMKPDGVTKKIDFDLGGKGITGI